MSAPIPWCFKNVRLESTFKLIVLRRKKIKKELKINVNQFEENKAGLEKFSNRMTYEMVDETKNQRTD